MRLAIILLATTATFLARVNTFSTGQSTDHAVKPSESNSRLRTKDGTKNLEGFWKGTGSINSDSDYGAAGEHGS
ncbi:hypothetical protein F441_05952 [Phytophthora nicotianae CJ01A1]|uniref:RxLR effector protein n=4 Tax=Phytophthora nicotianae TaxID=4792 RepID=W2RBY7_PHYN3|nr:hypothetical protein PPTG_20878 [Phytophthora nicotianae INRA-310]ETL43829.1 hypothetical protein L916_05756 [Phytophthora nicotianae]ETO79281.1 hypothetical protein F444_05999 [Phytophthora nicotianae P1976]ETP20314.1 hypothetical protein F441_05952 [Phytophthora nicotianae CJ01A1]ETL96994.1 hypothetical protein L917_05646 [Phytophthora nicotianae]ETM50144.1 hypothetical protein L914_05771 [Phytophthora nicotianae]